MLGDMADIAVLPLAHRFLSITIRTSCSLLGARLYRVLSEQLRFLAISAIVRLAKPLLKSFPKPDRRLRCLSVSSVSFCFERTIFGGRMSFK